MFKYLPFLFVSTNFYASESNFSDSFGSLIIFPFIFLLMYFLLIRPQSKKVKEHKDLLEKVKIGDEIVTHSGIVCKINKIFDKFVLVESVDNVSFIIKKDSISSLLPKGTIKQFK